MKLVVVYQCGDGCTYSCRVDQPIEYESGEALLVDLEKHAMGIIGAIRGTNPHVQLKFKNTDIQILDMIEGGVYYAPDVYTIEEWWEAYRC